MDGAFQDPDFLTLCASFWTQTIGLYATLVGISKVKGLHLDSWATIIGSLSFLTSLAALGLYFVYMTLGDSFMQVAAMLQV